MGQWHGFFFDASRHVLGCAALVEHLTWFDMPFGVSFCNTTHQSLRIMCSLKWDEHKHGNVSQGSGHGPVKANTDVRLSHQSSCSIDPRHNLSSLKISENLREEGRKGHHHGQYFDCKGILRSPKIFKELKRAILPNQKHF
jgi:hypothetical protein